MKLTDVEAIRQGLFEAAHSDRHVGRPSSRNFPVPVAGKTGTAEAPPGERPLLVRVVGSRRNHPKVVVVVLIAHGGFGARRRRRRRSEIYQAFFHLKH